MPVWDELQKEVEQRRASVGPSVLDVLRRERLQKLHARTGRPLIIYAVDFIHQPDKARAAGQEIQIDLADKEGFVEVMRDLPPGPLDLLIHSPGGNPLAAESIVSLLRSKFNSIRVFVPNIAKSAATMVALSANEIAMDERGELGPIDPQMVLVSDQQHIISPAQGILDQFEFATREVQADPSKLPAWLPILRQFGPSLLVQSRNAIELSKALVERWLLAYMLADDPEAAPKAKAITSFFGEHNNFLSHGRMVGVDNLPNGVKVLDLRKDRALGDLVWELYTTIGLTFSQTGAFKIIENNKGQAYIRIVQQVQMIGQLNAPQPQQPSLPTGQPHFPPSRQQRRQAERQAQRHR